MKKVISLILVLSLVACFFAGCTTEAPGAAAPEAGAAAPEAAAPEAGAAAPEAAAPEAGAAVDVSGLTAFDDFPYPKVKTDGKLKVGCLHPLAQFTSVVRILSQIEIECANRGWTYVDGLYESTDQTRDVWEALLNADIDVLFIEGVDDLESYSDMLEKTRNAGIGIYGTETNMKNGVIATVNSTGATGAMQQFYYMASQLNFDAKVGIATAMGAQQHRERTSPVVGVLTDQDGVWSTMELLAYEDMGGPNESMQNCYDTTIAWIQQYGKDMNMIYTSSDAFGQMAAEALMTQGYTSADCITGGLDGDSSSFSAIADKDNPFVCTYIQNQEEWVHTLFELMEQIQVKGIAPGADGSIIPFSGYMIYMEGQMVTIDNLPTSGSTIHTVFSYYDESDPDGWWFWTADGVETMMIEY